MSKPEETTARDYECFTVTVTKRAADEVRRVAAERQCSVETLMEAAIEDAAIHSERGR